MAAKRSRQLTRPQEDDRPPAARATVASVQTYSGPLPAPADLERYDAVVPGMAERLLAKFEQQADHRMALEKHVVHADVERADRGLIAAIVFGVAVLVAAVAFILTGHEGAGTTTIVVEFLAYGGLFLYGSETRRRERNKKAGGR